MLTPVKLTVKKENTGTIYIPASLGIAESIQSVSFGTSTMVCKSTTSDDTELKISEDLFSGLQIPYENKIHVFFHDKTLYIGPLVGIFSAGFIDSKLRPIGERSLFFAKLLTAEKSVGVFSFIFGAHHINWEKGTIEGFFYKNTGWEQIEVPFPNVIYDRLPNRKTEKHQAIKAIKDRLANEYLIPWFNPGFFNKWEIHQQLEGDGNVSKYLPETHKHPSFSLIEQMLANYQHVYLKPANGSLGLGIFQIIYEKEEGLYFCRYKNDAMEKKLQKFSSLESLVRYLFRNKRLEDYIVQQGIHLIRIDHKALDFRLHTNKDEDGKWKVSVLAGKISGRGSVTTHLNSGGVVRTIEELFPDAIECGRVKEELERAALSLSEAIDSRQKGNLGEIGFDLGLDKNGKVWLFEANSKPGRSIFSHPRLRGYDKLTSQLPLQYAIYLTEKTIKKPEDIYK